MKKKRKYLKSSIKCTKITQTYFFEADIIDLLAQGYCGSCCGYRACCPGPPASWQDACSSGTCGGC
jgi:hypothetical protein